MLAQDFNHMLMRFASSYPSSLQNSRLPVSVAESYFSVLGHLAPKHLAEAFKRLQQQERPHMPSASIVLQAALSYARGIAAPVETQNSIAPPHRQLSHYAGDGLPSCSRAIPINPSRRPEDYTEKVHANTDHFLDIIRAMKLKRAGGGEIAARIMAELMARPIGAPSRKIQPRDDSGLRKKDAQATARHIDEQELQGEAQCEQNSPGHTYNPQPGPKPPQEA